MAADVIIPAQCPSIIANSGREWEEPLTEIRGYAKPTSGSIKESFYSDYMPMLLIYSFKFRSNFAKLPCLVSGGVPA